MNNPTFYGLSDLQNTKEHEEHPWTFIADVYVDNVDIFAGLENNLSVLEKLKKHKVIPADCKYSPQASFIEVHFSYHDHGVDFVHKLNEYLQKKYDITAKAENF